ncbi:Apolipoprotein N-acyltransferase [Roseovarius mucosus DSM 17069]|uniref:Apolipoprotein N-acyltransferase n=1 Tax=Roseovarius mucosus DSM 17069 TaxID=1288298 RepID=A0A0A0HJ00_9RHOB|nr:apolipoprotein N-acyltransferase [Roseovarius mucosus]KGM86871.1 Apolipoprotein N-acyltransferase [Roseovarius mucosus DSM 17069]
MSETGRAAALMDQVAGRSGRWRLLVLLLLGGMAALGQAPVGAWPLSVLGFALLYGVFSRAAGWRQAAGIGWAFGTGYFLIALNWIIEPFLVDVARHGWMAPFALLGLSGGLALFWAVALGLGRALGGGALGFVGGLGLIELARGYVLTGFPWAQPGHVLIDTPLLHWASYLGSLGLTALVLLAAVALWAAMTGARRALLALGAMVILWPVGALLTPEAGVAPEAATVRLIQPNAPQHEKWDPDKIQGFFDRQLAFSAAGERPDLIVWPETAVPVMLERAATTLEVISDAAGSVPVVVGLQRRDEMRLYNTLALVEAGGSVAAVYDKHHLVPFGEYMPYGDQLARFGIHGMAAKDGQGFSSGPGAQVIEMGALGRALPLICYEGVFPQDLRAAPGRADFILLITNDAWFGKFSGPYQHLAQARLRSAEFGLPMVRVANTGVSAMIDATGRVTESLPLGEAGWRDAALPPPLPPTVYARLGDAPMLVIFLVFLGLSRLDHRRRAARI